jgi:hypothetical protein
MVAARMGPDLFGLARLPPPPPFLAGVDQGALGPELVAGFLRRVSLTGGTPARAELAPAALAADAGPVTRVRRGPRARRWGQPPKSGAPLLPEQTVIPHVVHGIWLGGPVSPGGRFAGSFGAAARRYAGLVDFVVWTDVPRWLCEAAEGPAAGRGGEPDGLGPVRAMLAWARCHGIHLVSIYEVFHAGAPMLLQAQFAAEMAKQLPRGYSGASDHLRAEIIYRFGGLYTDGDNHFDADAIASSPPGRLLEVIADVAVSVPGFTLHIIPPDDNVNGDVLIAPAHHPGVRLLMEVDRVSYLYTQPELFGGLPMMACRFAGRPSGQRWFRYTVAFRVGWFLRRTLGLLRLPPDAGLLVRVSKAITAGSEQSWSRDEVPVPLGALSGEQVTARAARAAAVLARQLVTREGNLHLTAVAPVVAALPDPDAAWVAVLMLLAELAERKVVPPVTSVTWFRWADDGTPEQVLLPPEAQALIMPETEAAGWLGAELAAAGEPAWLLDEAVVPARLRARPVPGARWTTLRALTEVVAGGDGAIAGLRIRPARPGPGGLPLVLPGFLVVEVAGRLGLPWAGPGRQHPLTPEDVALLLCDLGLAGRPVLLVDQGRPAGGPTLRDWAARLAALLRQPVLPVDGQPLPELARAPLTRTARHPGNTPGSAERQASAVGPAGR